jgi:Transglutaminase-like superfamily
MSTAADDVNRSLLTTAKLSLAAEIVLVYARVRWVIRRYELPRAVTILRTQPQWRSRRLALSDGRAGGFRLSAAVIRTLELLPVDSRCLMRSLVLLRLMARRRVDSELVIAVKPTGGLGLDAHAWVEIDGLPFLVPGGPEWGRLITL